MRQKLTEPEFNAISHLTRLLGLANDYEIIALDEYYDGWVDYRRTVDWLPFGEPPYYKNVDLLTGMLWLYRAEKRTQIEPIKARLKDGEYEIIQKLYDEFIYHHNGDQKTLLDRLWIEQVERELNRHRKNRIVYFSETNDRIYDPASRQCEGMLSYFVYNIWNNPFVITISSKVKNGKQYYETKAQELQKEAIKECSIFDEEYFIKEPIFINNKSPEELFRDRFQFAKLLTSINKKVEIHNIDKFKKLDSQKKRKQRKHVYTNITI